MDLGGHLVDRFHMEHLKVDPTEADLEVDLQVCLQENSTENLTEEYCRRHYLRAAHHSV